MSKDLTNSSLDRKNILNNNLAIQEVYEKVGFYGIKFEGKYRFTKQQIANYFEVDIRTIDRILENHKEELEHSGYELFVGQKLKGFKTQVADFIRVAKENSDVHDIDVANILQLTDNEMDSLSKTPQLSVFTYKAFLNVGMLENPPKLTPCYHFKVVPLLQSKLTPVRHFKLTPKKLQ